MPIYSCFFSMSLTLSSYIAGVQQWSLSPRETLTSYIQKAKNDPYNARLRFHEDYADRNIDVFSQLPLCWAPLGIKDNILLKGTISEVASKAMKWYVAPYTATCIDYLEKAWGCVIGKTNMDEFAMGASTEHSAYGPTKHPLDSSRVPWWSSGWSAVAVAADMCLWALWTDTWWSIRQPAALCGIVWTKPTYGRVSRYGVQAMASSLDQVGTFTKTVEDAVHLLDAISGPDARDMTSKDRKKEQELWYEQVQRTDLSGMRLAVPKQFMSEDLDRSIYGVCNASLDRLRHLGAEVEEVDVPLLKYVVPIYYILVPAEVSSNLARFDGMRFGLQDDTLSYDDIFAYYASVREQWLGKEVQRRCLIGWYVLSAGHADAYYHKACAVKQHLSKNFDALFTDYDAVIGPTTPDVAWKIGEKVADPVQMYLEDVYTCGANLMGLPALSLPVGQVNKDGIDLPVWLQIMCQQWQEGAMFGIAHALEKSIRG